MKNSLRIYLRLINVCNLVSHHRGVINNRYIAFWTRTNKITLSIEKYILLNNKYEKYY